MKLHINEKTIHRDLEHLVVCQGGGKIKAWEVVRDWENLPKIAGCRSWRFTTCEAGNVELGGLVAPSKTCFPIPHGTLYLQRVIPERRKDLVTEELTR